MTDPGYVDYAASAPPFPEALEAQARTASSWFANPSATHPAGAAARRELDRLRDAFCTACGFDGRLALTSGATEANNLAIHGFMRARPDARVAVAADAHASVWGACRRYGDRAVPVTPRNDGRISLSDVAGRLDDGVALFCCSHVSNETGVNHDVVALSSLCERRGVRCLIDGSQALGHVPVDLASIACAFYTFSAHKFGGPRGVGGLLFREPPGDTILDGGRQQWGLRAGTENLPGLAGAVEALQRSIAALPDEMPRLRALATGLRDRLKDAGLRFLVNGDPENGQPGLLSVSFPRLSGQALAADLALRGISVATGSACHADVVEPPRAVLALGRSPAEALGTLRISFGRHSTSAGAEALAEALIETVHRHAAVADHP